MPRSKIQHKKLAATVSARLHYTTGTQCCKQGVVYIDARSRMGEMWVSGNVFAPQNCDEYSTVASERSPVGPFKLTTVPASSLKTTVLSTVGTLDRLSDEQALINELQGKMP